MGSRLIGVGDGRSREKVDAIIRFICRVVSDRCCRCAGDGVPGASGRPARAGEMERGRVVVLDPEALAEIAEG
jgi:hypothetical protein